jgi:hypothetical protein
MRALVVPALSVLLVSGCVTVNKQALAPTSTASLQNQTVTQTVRKKPDFAATTAGTATFGLIGALAAVSEGNKLIASAKIDDPADAISAGLSQALAAHHGTRVVSPSIAADGDDPKEIAAPARGKARFVVDVKTFNWGFVYFPTDWTHYRLMYAAKARLIDTETNNVIAEGLCKQMAETNANAPTYDQMMAGGAAWLKQELSRYAGACTRSLAKDMFALDSGPAAPDATPLAAIPPGQPATPLAANGGPVAASPDAEQWAGVMSCGELQTRGEHTDAYKAAIAMEVRGNDVTVHRKTATLLETMSGTFDRNSLQLHGGGHRLDDPSKQWQLAFDGEFPVGATTYTGKGKMFIKGRTLRDCELKLTRKAPRAI